MPEFNTVLRNAIIILIIMKGISLTFTLFMMTTSPKMSKNLRPLGSLKTVNQIDPTRIRYFDGLKYHSIADYPKIKRATDAIDKIMKLFSLKIEKIDHSLHKLEKRVEKLNWQLLTNYGFPFHH